METIGDFLPLLIFILIPILRGLNTSKKQKEKYQKTRRANKFPNQQQEESSSAKPWKSILDEISKEIKDSLEETQKKTARKSETNTKQENLNYNKDKEVVTPDIIGVETYKDVGIQPSKPSKPADVLGGEITDGVGEVKTRKSIESQDVTINSLEFSRNPIIQGLIFSEILGPPKSKR